MLVTIVLGSLAAISVALMLWQWVVAARFPLHKGLASPGLFPAITLLKPLKGCDAETENCLRSWLTQRYGGQVQFLFGVRDANDPVCGLVRGLLAAHPGHDTALVICPKLFGPNAKISTLMQLYGEAKHEMIVISDADVWVGEQLLSNLAASLEPPGVGLVSCFYSFASPANTPMRIEALAVNADFWSQVLQAASLGKIDFALGAVMATRKKNLTAIGGFDALVDYLADDYQIGNRIARTGAGIVISPTFVECRSSPIGWREVWQHQLRWARTIRACRPVAYFFSILSNVTLWAALFAAFGPSSEAVSWVADVGSLMVVWIVSWGQAFLVVTLLTRIAMALHLQWRLTRKTDHYAWWYLPPLKDLFAVAVWTAAFIGNTVDWRGRRYQITRGGALRRS